MVSVYLFIVKFSELPLLQCPHVIPPLCRPPDALCCSAGRTTAPTRRAQTISWFATGFLTYLMLTAKLSGNLCHIFTHQTDMSTKAFWSKGRKRKIQLAQAATWMDNFSWAQSPFGHNSSGQVRYRPMLTTIPSFSLQNKIFPTHSHFAVTTMPVPLPQLWGQRESCAGESNHKHLWELRQIKSCLWRKTVKKFLY